MTACNKGGMMRDLKKKKIKLFGNKVPWLKHTNMFKFVVHFQEYSVFERKWPALLITQVRIVLSPRNLNISALAKNF